MWREMSQELRRGVTCEREIYKGGTFIVIVEEPGTSTPNARSIDRFVNELEPNSATMVDYATGMVSTLHSTQLKPGRNR
jgi:hypothetical protein